MGLPTERVGAHPAVLPVEWERLPTTRQPDPALMTYYALSSLLAGPFFLFPLVYYFFRYRSMRYQVEEEGITMRWGILFRREISLTYSRIQDIHLSSNLVERWLGIARIQVQTASGSAKAEMTIEGLREFEAVRDFLYDRMRGSRDRPHRAPGTQALLGAGELADLTAALQEITVEVRALRQALPAPAVTEVNDG